MNNIKNEYKSHEVLLLGNKDSLDKLRHLIRSKMDEEGIVQASDLMRASGVIPDAKADDIWWCLADDDHEDYPWADIMEYSNDDSDEIDSDRLESVQLSLRNQYFYRFGYVNHDVHLNGRQESLEEIKQLFKSKENEEGLVRASDLMRAYGIEPEADDDDIWWSAFDIEGYVDENGDRCIFINEFSKVGFDERRILSILKNLEKVHGLSRMLWEIRYSNKIEEHVLNLRSYLQ